MTTTLRHVTYDLSGYEKPSTPPQKHQSALVQETILSCGGDMFCVQGISGATPHERTSAFLGLVHDVEMSCVSTHPGTGDPTPVFDPICGVGVMWRGGVCEPITGSMRVYDHVRLPAGMALVRLMINEIVEVVVASTVWPAGLPRQRDGVGEWVAAEVMAQGGHCILGGSWHNIYPSPDYDRDPFAHLTWQPRHASMARQDLVTGTAVGRRTATRNLEEGGLHDPARFKGVEWYRTNSYPIDHTINVRTVGPMVTRPVAEATQTITSLDSVPAREASQRLPVILELDPTLLTTAPAGER